MVNTIMSTMKKINKEKGEHMRKTILIMTLLLAVSLTGCGTTQNKNSETTVAKSMTENDYNKAVEKLTDKSAYQTIVEDFDSDNNKEAFVLTREGKDNEAVEDKFELWFSNGDKTEKILGVKNNVASVDEALNELPLEMKSKLSVLFGAMINQIKEQDVIN